MFCLKKCIQVLIVFSCWKYKYQKQKMDDLFNKAESWSSQPTVESNEIFNSITFATAKIVTIDDILGNIAEEVGHRRTSNKIPETSKYTPQCKKWSRGQTQTFYQILKTIGPDFTCMESHIKFVGKRCKKELRNKYRKQSRCRLEKVQKALQDFYNGEQGLER